MKLTGSNADKFFQGLGILADIPENSKRLFEAKEGLTTKSVAEFLKDISKHLQKSSDSGLSDVLTALSSAYFIKNDKKVESLTYVLKRIEFHLEVMSKLFAVTNNVSYPDFIRASKINFKDNVRPAVKPVIDKK